MKLLYYFLLLFFLLFLLLFLLLFFLLFFLYVLFPPAFFRFLAFWSEPESEPDTEDEEEEEVEMSVVEVEYDGKTYYHDENTQSVYDPENSEKVGTMVEGEIQFD